MQLAVAPTRNTNDKVKLPDFGLLARNETTGELVRIGYVQHLELHKQPVMNGLLTKLVVFGIQLEPEELKKVLEKFLENGYEPKEAVNIILQMKKLLSIHFDVRMSTVKSYPFCKIALLTPRQLQFVCEIYGLEIPYDAYKLFMITILTKEFLEPVYKAEGIAEVPEFNLDDNVTTTTPDDENLQEALLSFVQEKKSE